MKQNFACPVNMFVASLPVLMPKTLRPCLKYFLFYNKFIYAYALRTWRRVIPGKPEVAKLIRVPFHSPIRLHAAVLN
jgi:hypothetical protein